MSKQEREPTILIVRRGLRRRYRREQRFRLYGMLSVLMALASLVFLFTDIAIKGYPAFQHTLIALELHYDPQLLGVGPRPSEQELQGADYESVLKDALRLRFPEVGGRAQKRELNKLLSGSAAYDLRDHLSANPALLGQRESRWLLASSRVDGYVKEADVIGNPASGLSAVSYTHLTLPTSDLV